MPDTPDEIITQIFSHGLNRFSSSQRILDICPTYQDIKALASKLSDEPREEDLQKFLEEYPRFLTGLCGQGYDTPLAFFTKPQIGSMNPEKEYRDADFAIMTYGQGNAAIYLIEIKRSATDLYTKAGLMADDLRKADMQVSDWSNWLDQESNIQTFASNLLRRAKGLPQYPEWSDNRSFRLFLPKEIEELWHAFGGRSPEINYIVIIGRWAKLSEVERSQLLHNNRKNKLYKIFTYDQVARYGFDRPYFLPP